MQGFGRTGGGRRLAWLLAAAMVWLLLPSNAGALTQNATTVSVSADGTRVYAGFDGAGFSIFSRDPNTGALSLIGEAPTTSSGGALFDPALVPTADGADVYGVDGQSNTLFQYAPTSTGVTQQQNYQVLPDPTVAKDPITLAVSPDGSSVYVLTYGVQNGGGVGVTSNGKISAFHRDRATGNLTLVGTTPLDTSPNFGGAVGVDPILSPDGKFVYVSSPSATNGIYVLARDSSTGAVTALGRDGNLNAGIAIAMSPDGNYVYEAGPPSSSSSASSAISVLARSASTGRLTFASQVSGLSGLSDMWSLAVSPDGTCLYATSRAEGSLGYFTRNPSTGALTLGGVLAEGTGGVTGLRNAREVSVSPDGKNVYVASPDDGGISVFTRNPTTCAPSFLQLAQDLFVLDQPTLNQTDGTATLPVDVKAAGGLDLSLTPLATAPGERQASLTPRAIPVGAAGVVDLPIGLTGQAEQQLDTLHQLTVRVDVTFTATGGTPTTKTTVIQLVKAPASLTQLSVSPHRASLAGRLVRRLCVTPTRKNRGHRRCRRPPSLKVTYALSGPAAVTLTVTHLLPGRRVHGACVTTTHKNAKHPRCTQVVSQGGQIALAGQSGDNVFRFNGSIGGRLLGPGSYELIATPTGGQPSQAAFQLTS